MAGGWQGSTRRERLPDNWPEIRSYVLERDGYQCMHIRVDTEQRCTERATDVDHVHRGDDHRYENLASKCDWHHKRKTAAEANQARHVLPAATRMALEKRPPKRHPGVIDAPAAGGGRGGPPSPSP